jgi:hypothetical protein
MSVDEESGRNATAARSTPDATFGDSRRLRIRAWMPFLLGVHARPRETSRV